MFNHVHTCTHQLFWMFGCFKTFKMGKSVRMYFMATQRSDISPPTPLLQAV